MARGDYDATELTNMSLRAREETANPYLTATDALRVLPQLSAADLQVCIAFRLDPFIFAAAKLDKSEEVAAERQERIDRVERAAQYDRDREARARDALKRLHDARTPDEEVSAREALGRLGSS